AVTHIILKEWHHQKQTPYFLDYTKQYTDSPFLVKLEKEGDKYVPGQLVRANEMTEFSNLENGDWKFLNIDSKTGKLVVPKGSMGHRWAKDGGRWNMKLEHELDDQPHDPYLTLIDNS